MKGNLLSEGEPGEAKAPERKTSITSAVPGQTLLVFPSTRSSTGSSHEAPRWRPIAFESEGFPFRETRNYVTICIGPVISIRFGHHESWNSSLPSFSASLGRYC